MPKNKPLKAPILEISPDLKTRDKFMVMKESLDLSRHTNWNVLGQRYADSFAEYDRILREGSNEEALGMLLGMDGYNPWQPGVELHRRIKRHMMELDGSWSELLAIMLPLTERKFPPGAAFLKKWKSWAESLDNPRTFDKLVDPVFELESAAPIEMIARYAPVATSCFVKRILENWKMDSASEIVLAREDLPAEIFKDIIEKDLERWGTGLGTDQQRKELGEELHRYTYPIALDKILNRPHWQGPDFAERVIEAFERLYTELCVKKNMSAGLFINNTVKMIAGWEEARKKDWRELYRILRQDSGRLGMLVENPGFPLDLARSILSNESCGARIKQGLGQNPVLRLDKEIREGLMENGQDTRIWEGLLRSSVDPDEAGRLLSFIASKNIKAAKRIVAAGQIPVGTKVPSTVMVRIMTGNTGKKRRVDIIKGISKIKPVAEPVALMPKKSRVGRTR